MIPKNYEHVSGEDAKIYGRHTVVTCVNPMSSRFVVEYSDGGIIYGKNLITTGWDDIPHGIKSLSYILSTKQIIKVPPFRAYLPLIDCSVGIDGSRLLHSINVKCLGDTSIVNYKIMLKQDTVSNTKIGDIFLSVEPKCTELSSSWKKTIYF